MLNNQRYEKNTFKMLNNLWYEKNTFKMLNNLGYDFFPSPTDNHHKKKTSVKNIPIVAIFFSLIPFSV